jgi:Protein of unknown function (DUF1232)
MSEQSWKPLFRAPKSTVTKVLQSQAFISSRRQAGVIFDDAAAVRELGDVVESLDLASAPLSTIADRVAAAVSFLRFHADALDAAQEQRRGSSEAGVPQVGAGAASVTRERLIVAALHYLVTPVDLVPDFRPGGYIDDVLLLSWVFGAAAHELQPFLKEDLDS